MRCRLSHVVVCGVLLLAAVAVGVGTAVGQVAGAKLARIRVKEADWNAPRENLEAVCRSAAEAIWREMPNRDIAPIIVGKTDGSPIVLYQRGPNGEYQVNINVTGTYWAQCAFQFAHEFGHIWFNTRPGANPQMWLEESLCELASLYALRRMAEMWEENPPYVNWKSYAANLRNYAEERIKAGKLEEGVTFAAWFEKERQTLQAKAHDRERNLVVAVQLLPLLEANPRGWQALAYLNRGKIEENETLERYLTAWHDRVPRVHQAFVREVAAQFDVKIAESAAQRQ